MATGVMVPLSEYLTTVYEPDVEWVDGELKERHVGEGSHASVQKFFLLYFGVREQELGIRVYAELRLQVTANNYRVPDVMVKRFQAPFEEIVTVPPLLCIEILSPDDRMSDMREKLDEYTSMGVETVWVVDPRRQGAEQTDGRSLHPVDVLTVPGTAISIPVPDVFAELNEYKQRAESAKASTAR